MDQSRLEELLASNSPDLEIWCRLLVARAEGSLDAQVDWLVSCLRDERHGATWSAVLALDSLGPAATRALPALEALRPPPSGVAAAFAPGPSPLDLAIRHISGAR
jgi:hypothetical protein